MSAWAKPALVAPAALLMGQGYIRPEPPSHVFAAGAKAAVVMAPAEVACGAYAREVVWTADGATLVVRRLVVPDDVPARTLMVARQTAEMRGIAALSRRTEIVAWSLRSRKSRLLFDFDPTTTKLGALEAIPGGERLWSPLEERVVDPSGKFVTRRGYLLIDVASGALSRVAIPDPERLDLLEFSAKGQGSLVQAALGGKSTSVTFVGADGRLGRIFPLPNQARFGWRPDGTPSVGVRELGRNGRPMYQEHAFDPVTGEIGPVLPPLPEVRDIEPELHTAEVPRDHGAREIDLSFADGKPEETGIVSADASNAELSPNGDAVAYLSGGSAVVRPLKRISRKEYEDAARDAAREQAMDRGRQIGLALQMYSADSDDVMPPSGANVADSVNPYARDRDVFTGFTYTFGGALPASGLSGVVLGYVSAPGGRVVVHGDGTVTWQPFGP